MRSLQSTVAITCFAIVPILVLGLVASVPADDGAAPDPAPPDDSQQWLDLPDVDDDIGAYLHLRPPTMLDAVRQLSVSDRQACMVLQAGFAYCWPLDEDHEDLSQPPHDLYAAVAVGADHACALDQTSRPVCWGDNRHGQLDAPNELFVDIAAGDHHTCGIDTTGTPICWGRLDTELRNPPDGPFEQISAGGDRTCVSGRWDPSHCFGGDTAPDEPFDEWVQGMKNSSDIVCARDLSNRPICHLDPAMRGVEPPSPVAADIAVGSGFVCTLEPSGSIRCDGPDAPDLPSSPPISETIDAGEDTLCAVTVWRELQCWDADGDTLSLHGLSDTAEDLGYHTDNFDAHVATSDTDEELRFDDAEQPPQ